MISKLIPVINTNALQPERSKFTTPMKSKVSDKDPFNRLTAQRVNQILHTHIQSRKTLLFDCRYPFEFDGGHIPFAMNCHNPNELVKMLFESSLGVQQCDIIFHCEFSSKRGPDMAKLVRQFDRKRNKNNYPHLDFPNIYILEGGYKAWYEKYGRSYNCEYLEMSNCHYNSILVKCESERKTWMSQSTCDMNNRAPMRFFTPSPMPSEKNIWDTSPISRANSPLGSRRVYDDSPFHHRNNSGDSDMMEFYFSIYLLHFSNDMGLDSLALCQLQIKNGSLDNLVATITSNNIFDINAKEDGFTMLHIAAIYDQLDIVQFLVSKGAQIEEKDTDGNTALNLAAYNDAISVVKYLLTLFPNVNNQEKYGWTALHQAAFFGNYVICLELLLSGAEIDTKSNSEWWEVNSENSSPSMYPKYSTPLHIAAINMQQDIIRLLRLFGANLDALDENKRTCFDIVANLKKEDIIGTEKKKEYTELIYYMESIKRMHSFDRFPMRIAGLLRGGLNISYKQTFLDENTSPSTPLEVGHLPQPLQVELNRINHLSPFSMHEVESIRILNASFTPLDESMFALMERIQKDTLLFKILKNKFESDTEFSDALNKLTKEHTTTVEVLDTKIPAVLNCINQVETVITTKEMETGEFDSELDEEYLKYNAKIMKDTYELTRVDCESIKDPGIKLTFTLFLLEIVELREIVIKRCIPESKGLVVRDCVRLLEEMKAQIENNTNRCEKIAAVNGFVLDSIRNKFDNEMK